MYEYIPTFQMLSEWHKVPYQSTTGTRTKRIYVEPESQTEYFFKCSKELDDGTIRYPLEFWSEITSSKIGKYLGFKILDYNIGFAPFEKQKVGCLSRSMILDPEDTLTEGVEYLRGFDSKYNPHLNESKYTLEFILKALYFFDLNGFESEIIEVLIFDALIGNSDRHQENWGFITRYSNAINRLEEQISKNPSWSGRWKLRLDKAFTEITHLSRKRDINKNKASNRTTLINQSFVESEFSPIYDSGCSLGRELSEDRIQTLLNSREELERYISRGKAEIRFLVGSKPKHFELMQFLVKNYREDFIAVQNRIREKWNDKDIRFIINNIDTKLPEELKDHKLPDIRKELMFNLVALRKESILGIK